MQNLSYISQNYSAHKTISYNLSIQIALNGLSFCIIDSSDNACLVIKNHALNRELSREAWEDHLSEIIKSESLFQGTWKQVRIIWSSRKSLMIPSDIFRKEDLYSYMMLHQMLEEYDEIHHTKLSIPDAWVAYSIPSSITQIMINKFPGALFYHQSIPMLDSVFNRKEQQLEDGIHANLQEGFFNYAVIKDGKLLSFNDFSWKEANDVLYLIVYLFRQFEFSTKAQELVIYSMGEEYADTIQLLKKYILNVRFAAPDKRFQIQHIDAVATPFAYSILLNLYFCES